MAYWETVHAELRDGFKVELATTPDNDTPDWDAETTREIQAGRLLWFSARVTASRHGVVLGTEYLGRCCYASTEEFLRDEYYQDLVTEALGDARRMIEKLEIPEVA